MVSFKVHPGDGCLILLLVTLKKKIHVSMSTLCIKNYHVDLTSVENSDPNGWDEKISWFFIV